jgi:flagellar L-ring protein precursor FlgH
MKYFVRCFVVLFMMISAGLGYAAEDLSNAYLFTTNRAFTTGDIITVIVMETTRASKEVSSKTGRKSGSSMDIAATGSTNKAKFNSDIQYEGGSSTERRGMLTARISARIVQTEPNGNLVIKGEQLIEINGEKQILKVSGVARPADISADNTVFSGNLADAHIEYLGKEKRSQWIHWLGPIGWIYNWLF